MADSAERTSLLDCSFYYNCKKSFIVNVIDSKIGSNVTIINAFNMSGNTGRECFDSFKHILFEYLTHIQYFSNVLLFLPLAGFELLTLRSSVDCSNHFAAVSTIQ